MVDAVVDMAKNIVLGIALKIENVKETVVVKHDKTDLNKFEMTILFTQSTIP